MKLSGAYADYCAHLVGAKVVMEAIKQEKPVQDFLQVPPLWGYQENVILCVCIGVGTGGGQGGLGPPTFLQSYIEITWEKLLHIH